MIVRNTEKLTKYCLLLLPRDREAKCAAAISLSDLFAPFNLSFSSVRYVNSPHEILPLPSLGEPETSTPTLRSVEYSHEASSPCNFHKGGSSPGLRVFHPNETLLLGLGPVLPSTLPHRSPCPIARTTSPELSQGAQAPEVHSPPLPSWESSVDDLE